MAGIELNPQAVSLGSLQAASQQAGMQAQKSGKAQKTSFAASLRRTQEDAALQAEGLPAEIAGMSEEDAVVFLKDAMDIAGDALKSSPTNENMAAYREKVSQFIRYVSRNNYRIIEKARGGRNRNGVKLAPFYQIQVINQKLDQLAADMLYNHRKNLSVLARVDEINGLVVDLMAG